MMSELSRGDVTARRARFDLRKCSALVIVLIVIAVIGAIPVASELSRALHQQAAIEQIRSLGGTVYTDGNVCDRLLWQPIIFYVDLSNTAVTDGDLAILRRFPPFTHLYLSNTRISDNATQQITALTSLKVLKLSGTEVTEEGIEHLHESLPRCKIEY